MYIVKISTSFSDFPLLRQTPNEKGIWDNVQFFINDDSIKEPDYWIVYNGLKKEEKAFCPKDNVILITGEPPTIANYNIKFIKQFNRIITCHRDMQHKNKIYWQQALPWHIGQRITEFIDFNNCKIEITKNYDQLKNKNIESKDKTKICSVISSNKNFIQGHRDRNQFVEILKNHFEDKIDIYGRGFKEIEDKWDAIAPYKYHIVIENSSFNDYWTEKLADAFLAEAYPIYYGAENIDSYFSKNSLTKIDIHSPEKAIKIIEKVIQEDYYNKYKNEIRESKQKILDEYNLFPTIVSKLIVQDIDKKHNKSKIILKPEIYFRVSMIKRLIKIILPAPLYNIIKTNLKKLRHKDNSSNEEGNNKNNNSIQR
ncbi:MAG: Glycosyltransferase family 10 (fucosyltransferase) [Candidatus Methanofastidiosum methylothiophilum]|uniref:Glycosyltransferase family 10 (Fucosyltransferase) n=1 Tax=Candidatus Methanofastidiosum methylothiophilum TaxID=1705564 RepID=A0A150IK42_9EURY|nr:MAG: Glycosyltransferase family 10 (fucosyltransferase) [Candidatus Methanofastidiosum methylthiophilus]KYC48475.1 MAG: Glycosyltransferase family 10 (fucosyltransferase) [Candidatus Methanofastidiosum methylthiophilus]KYC49917.1 MAG: Glycosyltransferase family 10 (fucosyltransferase) [Candidatus Methanofastidiosum methylthiophilus]